MSQRLFDTDEKIGVFCDGFHPRLEKQKGGDEVKVIDIAFRVQPFSPELAADLIGDGLIKRTLFRHDDGSQLPGMKSVAFDIYTPRQLMKVFAAPDVEEPSFAFDQVEVTNLKARTEKGIDGWALVFHASYGPVGDRELGQMQAWYTTQRFLTFEEAEPMLEFEADEEGTDADVKAQEAAPTLTEETQATHDAKRSTGVRQRTHSHQTKKKPGKAKSGRSASV